MGCPGEGLSHCAIVLVFHLRICVARRIQETSVKSPLAQGTSPTKVDESESGLDVV